MKSHEIDPLTTQTVSGSSFYPHFLIRNRHLQTILSSVGRPDARYLLTAAREMILKLEGEVRLQGFYSPQPTQPAKGLVLLLHGWLGCMDSHYVLGLGEYLYRRGYAVFRLNFRDHGDSHPLNPGLFRGDLLNEVFDAAQQISQLEATQPFHIVGASLGGNFALRIAAKQRQTPLPNLHHTVAINPAVNPRRATQALDKHFVYLNYFRARWRRSLQRKQQLFPDLYDFSEELSVKTCMAMTETIMRRYSPYPDAASYFESYKVSAEMMESLCSPVTILTSTDDPIVLIEDFYPFIDVSPHLNLNLQPHGGHVGFIHIFPFRSWLTEAVTRVIENS